MPLPLPQTTVNAGPSFKTEIGGGVTAAYKRPARAPFSLPSVLGCVLVPVLRITIVNSVKNIEIEKKRRGNLGTGCVHICGTYISG